MEDLDVCMGFIIGWTICFCDTIYEGYLYLKEDLDVCMGLNRIEYLFL